MVNRVCSCGMTSAEAYVATLRHAIEGAGPDSILGRLLRRDLEAADAACKITPDHKPETKEN